MNNALQGLGNLMGQQRQLMDRTFRAQQGQQGQRGQQGQQGQGQQGQGQQGQGQQGQGQQGQGQMGQGGQGGQGGQRPGQGQFGQNGQPMPGQGQPGGQMPGGTDPNALAQDQQGLRSQLDKIIQGLAQNGVQTPGALDQASREMGQSQNNLQGNQLRGAGDAQQRALDQLRSSAQELAKNIITANGQQPGQGGDQQNAQRTDPLGRPLDQAGSMAGGSLKIPDQSDLARAREILEELRKRAGEAGRLPQELDYIERLLKQF